VIERQTEQNLETVQMISIPIGVILAASMLLLCCFRCNPRIENTAEVELPVPETTAEEN